MLAFIPLSYAKEYIDKLNKEKVGDTKTITLNIDFTKKLEKSDNNDKYLKYLFENSNNIHKRDTSICYYDCTNFYFEIDEDDQDYVDEYTGELIEGTRKHGISKEHKNTPLVEMGLFMDKDGIPITMAIFPGNTNEQVTVKDLEIEMIKSFKDKRIIYCADSGLGSCSIRLLNDMPDKKFIVTQSIKKMNKVLIDECLKDEDFRFLSNDKKSTVSYFKEYDFNILKDTTKSYDEKKLYRDLYSDRLYKTLTVNSNIDLGLYKEVTLKNGKTVKRKSLDTLKQKIIITFSRKTLEYQRKVRNIQIEKAKAKINSKDFDFKKNPNDYTRFIKSNKEKGETTYTLDNDLIKEEEKYDGFYCLATNLLEDDVREIIRISSERYMIENCFRTLKTNFNARPIYHRLNRRIKAHFLICYTALLIYKLLDVEINKDLKGECYTINNILNTLKSMNVSNQQNQFYSSEYTNSKTLERLEEVFNLGLDKKNYTSAGIKKIIKKIS